MNTGININDPTVVAAFKAALGHQGAALLVIVVLLGLSCLTLRVLSPVPATAGDDRRAGTGCPAEPWWRRTARIGFGALWLLDGILLAQPDMAAGLPSKVIAPAAVPSPDWVRHLVNWGGTTWSYHPIQVGTAVVWLQAGLGLWLLVADRGPWSRLAGLASAGWGLVVWVLGEAFGGIFAPGLSWLSGAPGGALLYCAAGVLLALPERAWWSRRTGRLTLAGLGAFLLGMAVVQAWPGRGFWRGTTAGGRPSVLAAMTQRLARTSQPALISGWVKAFTTFEDAHGFAVNLVAVTALAAIGAVFLTGWKRLLFPALLAFTALCLATWVLVEDTGVFGGLGTNPGSMIPFALLATAGYLAVAPPRAGAATAPSATAAPADGPPAATRPVPAIAASALPSAALATASVSPEPISGGPRAPGGRERSRLTPSWPKRYGLVVVTGARRLASARLQALAAAAAAGLVLFGAVPLAAAQATGTADPVLADAVNGPVTWLNYPAADFRLTDQYGRAVSLSDLRGKVVLLTFLDPVCTTDCPLMAQEIREAGQQLAGAPTPVELVAVDANPVYRQVSDLRSFDKAEYLTAVSNWRYLTGTLPALRSVWHDYGVSAEVAPAGSMALHNDIAYVIDASGRVRAEFNMDPGPGTPVTEASFGTLLASTARHVMRPG